MNKKVLIDIVRVRERQGKTPDTFFHILLMQLAAKNTIILFPSHLNLKDFPVNPCFWHFSRFFISYVLPILSSCSHPIEFELIKPVEWINGQGLQWRLAK